MLSTIQQSASVSDNINAFHFFNSNCTLGKIPIGYGFVDQLEVSTLPGAIHVILNCLTQGEFQGCLANKIEQFNCDFLRFLKPRF